jgi:hypothetical protein
MLISSQWIQRPNRRNLATAVTGNICLSDSVSEGKFWVLLRSKGCTENAIGLMIHAGTQPSRFSETRFCEWINSAGLRLEHLDLQLFLNSKE